MYANHTCICFIPPNDPNISPRNSDTERSYYIGMFQCLYQTQIPGLFKIFYVTQTT